MDMEPTSSDRIKQLSEIDRDIVKLLRSAGLAVKALASSTSDPKEPEDQPLGIQQQKEAFTAAATQYFTLLSSIDVRLRQQISALEEAEIIPAEGASRESQKSLAVPGSSKGAITGGGLGSLDVGWLNSRNDNVGKEMEAELWEKAQTLVDGFVKKSVNGEDIDLNATILSEHAKVGNGDQQMDQS